MLVTLALGGCKSYYDTLLKSDDTAEKFKAAMKYYENKRYRKASELFENLILVTQGTPQEDTVQYYNALSNYKYGDYTTAEANFAKYLEVFPRSPFTEEAKFLRIKCLYEGTYRWELDQLPTQKAMSVITEFMYDNPGSQYYDICKAMMSEFQERLDRKSYEAAKLYYRMEDYKAAHYALRTVLKDNADNQYREQILYYTALSSYKFAAKSIAEKQKERFMTYVDDYYNFVGEYPDAKERKELDSYFVDVKKITGLKVDVDSTTLANANSSKDEIEGAVPKSKAKIKADRRSAKQAVKDAKRVVKIAESQNAVARAVSDEKDVKNQKVKGVNKDTGVSAELKGQQASDKAAKKAEQAKIKAEKKAARIKQREEHKAFLKKIAAKPVSEEERESSKK